MDDGDLNHFNRRVIERLMIPPQSKKRIADNRVYNKLKRELFKKYPKCQRCKKAPSKDCHHAYGRGPNFLNPKTWFAVCRKCHDWIGEHKADAREEGFICSIGQWMCRQPE